MQRSRLNQSQELFYEALTVIHILKELAIETKVGKKQKGLEFEEGMEELEDKL